MTNKDLLREKAARRAALLNNIEDLNIRALALTGEVRHLDDQIDSLMETLRKEYFEEKNSDGIPEGEEYPEINPYS